MAENSKKKILVTGGAGGVGAFVCGKLLEAGHSVRVFDLPSPANTKSLSRTASGAEAVWGDITDEKSVREAVAGCDEVIHLAALVVPATEAKPDLAHRVNVGGVKNIIRAVEAETESSGKPVAMRFSSSATVYGITANEHPPIAPDHPVSPTSVYTETKILAEEAIRASGLPRWTIFRFAAAQYLTMQMDKFSQMKIIPPDNRIEFVHILDIADAFINAIGNKETYGGTFVLAGGPRCQMLYRDQLRLTFRYLGFPDPNWKKFTKEPFALDWYDTAEANRILRYQNRTFDDYLTELRRGLGFKYQLLRYSAAPLMQLLRIHL